MQTSPSSWSLEQQGHDDSPCACASHPLVGNREKKRKGRSNQVARRKCSLRNLTLKRTFTRKKTMPCCSLFMSWACSRRVRREKDVLQDGVELIDWNCVEIQRNLNVRYSNSQNTENGHTLHCKKPIFLARLHHKFELCLLLSAFNWYHFINASGIATGIIFYACYASIREVNRILQFI